MATVIRSTVKAILPFVRTKLIDEEFVLDGTQVQYSIDPRAYDRHPKGELYLLFVPGGEGIDEEGGDYNGRHDRRAIRKLNVHLRTRLNQDMTRQHKEWLLDTDKGHIGYEDELLDILDYFMPKDENNNDLLYMPMQYRGISQPYTISSPGWGESIITFDLPYTRNYTNADRNYY